MGTIDSGEFSACRDFLRTRLEQIVRDMEEFQAPALDAQEVDYLSALFLNFDNNPNLKDLDPFAMVKQADTGDPMTSMLHYNQTGEIAVMQSLYDDDCDDEHKPEDLVGLARECFETAEQLLRNPLVPDNFAEGYIFILNPEKLALYVELLGDLRAEYETGFPTCTISFSSKITQYPLNPWEQAPDLGIGSELDFT